MSILRGSLPADGFTLIQNEWLRDPQLSAKAKGLLCYIASHAAGYQLTVEQMVREMSDSITAIRSGLAELEETGYLRRERSRDDAGRLGVYEYSIGSICAGHAQSTKPTVDNPPVDNVTTKKNIEKKTTEKKNREDPFDVETSETAQTILRSFIDWIGLPAQGSVKLTPSVIARYGRTIKALLQANYDSDTIRRALALMTERGKAGWPSMLDSFCVEVQNRPRPVSGGPTGAAKSFKQVDRDDKQREDSIIDLASELLEHGKADSLKEARTLAERIITDQGLKISTTSSGFGYIEAEVVDVETHPEVTDHEAS